jgi:hypothetical protein
MRTQWELLFFMIYRIVSSASIVKVGRFIMLITLEHPQFTANGPALDRFSLDTRVQHRWHHGSDWQHHTYANTTTAGTGYNHRFGMVFQNDNSKIKSHQLCIAVIVIMWEIYLTILYCINTWSHTITSLNLVELLWVIKYHRISQICDHHKE